MATKKSGGNQATMAMDDAATEREGPIGGPVTVKLGGREYTLRYDLNALAYIGDKLGITLRLGQLGDDLLGAPLPLSALRVIIYAGIRHQVDDDVTEEDVGGWVNTDNVNEVAQAFFSLFGVSLQELSQAQMLGGGGTDASAQAGKKSR